MSLKDQRNVILGGSPGPDFVKAKAAADEGARVVVTSSIQDELDSLP